MKRPTCRFVLIAVSYAAQCAVAQSSPGALTKTFERVFATSSESSDSAAGWFCPMHPDVTATSPGVCSKCGMRLLAGMPFDTREYELDFQTEPAAVQTGKPTHLRLEVREPGTGAVVREFESVHEKPFHLFVISQDLSIYQHLHPVIADDGAWNIDVTLPKPGYYRVLSDFVPKGGSPQMIARSFATAGYDHDLLSETTVAVDDAGARVKTIDGITAELQLDPLPLVAGQFGHLDFVLRDSRSGEPIEDLEPYLGAYGHSLIVRADTLDAVHSHPNEGPDNNIAKGRGGPRVTFEGYLPTPGLYRAWAQFQRGGHVSTLMFTFDVLSIEEAFEQRERGIVQASAAGAK